MAYILISVNKYIADAQSTVQAFTIGLFYFHDNVREELDIKFNFVVILVCLINP